MKPIDTTGPPRRNVDEGFDAVFVANINNDRFRPCAVRNDFRNGLFCSCLVRVFNHDKRAFRGQSF
jgi:hypothetical protein